MTGNGLVVDNLCAAYGRAQVLFGISLEVGRGEAITLLGRNGMGRTSIIKCIFGILPTQEGSIVYHGRSLDQLPPYRIARLGLGLVPEGREIFPNLSVEENLVATSRAPRDGSTIWDLARVYQFLPKLHERRRHLGSALSGGEQQMLAIGRALMTNPTLLVLDEATEGLAPVIRSEIWKVLKSLRNDGLSMIVVDKDLTALRDFTDRHYVLENGSVIWSGTSEQLHDNERLIQQHLSV